MSPWNRYAPPLYNLTRLVVGLLFSCHGAQKLFGAFGGQKMHGKMMVAGIIEFGGGLLIAVGLFASFVAIITALEMIYAYATVHSKMGLWPIENKGELALLYLAIFIFIIAYGDGTISLGAMFRRK